MILSRAVATRSWEADRRVNMGYISISDNSVEWDSKEIWGTVNSLAVNWTSWFKSLVYYAFAVWILLFVRTNNYSNRTRLIRSQMAGDKLASNSECFIAISHSLLPISYLSLLISRTSKWSLRSFTSSTLLFTYSIATYLIIASVLNLPEPQSQSRIPPCSTNSLYTRLPSKPADLQVMYIHLNSIPIEISVVAKQPSINIIEIRNRDFMATIDYTIR